ncbi:MAG: hypothetical protein SO253_04100 [Bacilli bacterium]|nr:hypothetical protein [Bacilli bacterium]
MKKSKIIGVALTTLLLTSCSNNDQSSSSSPSSSSQSSSTPPSSSIDVYLHDSIKLYNEVERVMKNQVYEIITKGISINDAASSPLTIYGLYQQNNGEIYFENVSNGNAILFFNVAFAERAYVNKDVIHRQSATTNKKWPEDDGVVTVNNYGEVRDSTQQELINEFGKENDQLCNFVIDYDTVKDINNSVVKENDNYLCHYDILIDPNDSLNSKGVKGYANQVYTMSKKTVKKINKISMDFVIDKDFKIIEYKTKEEYVVKTGMPLISEAKVTNNLTYSFKYYDDGDLVVKKF